MPKFTPSLVGFIFAGLIFAARKYGKKWLHHIDNYLLTTGFILLFYSVLRLSHFSKDVFIQNNFVDAKEIYDRFDSGEFLIPVVKKYPSRL